MAKKPDYRLKILNKKTDKSNQNAGAAWLNKDGSLSIVLNPGIVIDDNEDKIYTLFKYDQET